jgi:hypothetical protein
VPPPTSSTARTSEKTGNEVKTVRPGVMFNCGLLNVEANRGLLRLPRVKTVFGGNLWVIRSLAPSEILSCWDVTERLGQLIGADNGRK